MQNRSLGEDEADHGLFVQEAKADREKNTAAVKDIQTQIQVPQKTATEEGNDHPTRQHKTTKSEIGSNQKKRRMTKEKVENSEKATTKSSPTKTLITAANRKSTIWNWP